MVCTGKTSKILKRKLALLLVAVIFFQVWFFFRDTPGKRLLEIGRSLRSKGASEAERLLTSMHEIYPEAAETRIAAERILKTRLKPYKEYRDTHKALREVEQFKSRFSWFQTADFMMKLRIRSAEYSLLRGLNSEGYSKYSDLLREDPTNLKIHESIVKSHNMIGYNEIGISPFSSSLILTGKGLFNNYPQIKKILLDKLGELEPGSDRAVKVRSILVENGITYNELVSFVKIHHSKLRINVFLILMEIPVASSELQQVHLYNLIKTISSLNPDVARISIEFFEDFKKKASAEKLELHQIEKPEYIYALYTSGDLVERTVNILGTLLFDCVRNAIIKCVSNTDSHILRKNSFMVLKAAGQDELAGKEFHVHNLTKLDTNCDHCIFASFSKLYRLSRDHVIELGRNGEQVSDLLSQSLIFLNRLMNEAEANVQPSVQELINETETLISESGIAGF